MLSNTIGFSWTNFRLYLLSNSLFNLSRFMFLSLKYSERVSTEAFNKPEKAPDQSASYSIPFAI